MINRFFTLLTASFILTILTPLAAQKAITLEDIWVNGTFSQKSLHGVKSMNDGTHYSTLERSGENQEINQYSYSSGKKTGTLVQSADLVPEGATKPVRIGSYDFSHDEKKMLISTNVEHIYRHSRRQNIYIFDLKSKKLTLLAGGAKVQEATFSPDGQKVAYVKDNNLFYTEIKSNKEIQVTTDGIKNKIINGISDWVYEEELVLVRAYEWSPDNNKIAFYRFDESDVKEFSMAIYDNLYPTEYRFKYPKAGEANSRVSIHIHNLSTGKTIPVNLIDNEYIPRIQWTKDPNMLAIMGMNRLQNRLLIFFADANTGASNEVFREESGAYIEIGDNLHFVDGNGFFWMSERSGYNQLYLFNTGSGEMKQLTGEQHEVTSFIGYDEERKKVYYMRADYGDPINRYLHVYDMESKQNSKLTVKKGFHNVKFSKGFEYYIDFNSTINEPLRITVNDPSNGKEVRIIQENEELKQKTREYGFTETTFFSFKNRFGDDLNGWMIKPPDFDPSKKYPVLMYVYGGPGSQTVRNSWGGSNYAWYQMLAQQGYIVASVDNRGTGGRGYKFRVCTYKQLGNLETQDQIDAAAYLGQQSYVDSNRIGIWGWSYGGYMTTLCMTKGANHFKTGIAVAPVTNWRFYDSIYTERYMQTPQENASGYDDNSPINHVEKLKGKYLLVHGTADDNVHFQNTTELIQALVKEGKQFELGVYPDKNHSIGGKETRLHLFRKMTDFIVNNL